MLNIKKIRQDFPMIINKKMQGKPLIYLDSGATTLKPKKVIDAVCEYLSNYSGNAHRGDYDLSYEVDSAFEGARKKIADFINAKEDKEIVFTSGASESLNLIAFGYVYSHIQSGEEILISMAEHASNTLPWFEIAKVKNAVVKYIDLDEHGRITIENVKKAITPNTKYISLAMITNVLGYEAPIKEITSLAHEHGIIMIVDGAQSVPHQKTDVQDLDIDFLVFSGHKMCGPTGIGVMYGKYPLLQDANPIRFGGGSNARYNSCGVVTLKNAPAKFEVGTPNIEGAIGLGAAVDYLMSIGMNEIEAYEKQLRQYAIQQLSKLDNVEIYNKDSSTGPISFNLKGVFSQDGASLLNSKGIAVRAGQHCAKILEEFLGVSQTLRVSLYFYNTFEEIDALVEACKKGDDFLDAFF